MKKGGSAHRKLFFEMLIQDLACETQDISFSKPKPGSEKDLWEVSGITYRVCLSTAITSVERVIERI